MARIHKNDPQKPHGLYQPLVSKEGAMAKILCVDDDPSILDLYYEEFSDEGYEVLLARNGQEALEKYQEQVPQLTIMDIRMPGMDGIEALNAILGKNRQASVIIYTAFSHYRDNFMTWGAEAYLIKSSDLSELKQKVREVFAGLPKAAETSSSEIKMEGTVPRGQCRPSQSKAKPRDTKRKSKWNGNPCAVGWRTSMEEEIYFLKEEADLIRDELEGIDCRIKELENEKAQGGGS
jgi:CheY-like chemotaxis protein